MKLLRLVQRQFIAMQHLLGWLMEVDCLQMLLNFCPNWYTHSVCLSTSCITPDIKYIPHFSEVRQFQMLENIG